MTCVNKYDNIWLQVITKGGIHDDEPKKSQYYQGQWKGNYEQETKFDGLCGGVSDTPGSQ